MHQWFTVTLCLLLATLLQVPAKGGSLRKAAPAHKIYDLREGDIVLQGNLGPQSDAVRAATQSPFTHCGVVFQHEGQWMVMEATQPVRTTPLDRFIQRSVKGTYKALRLNRPLSPDEIAKARAWATQQAGKDYDIHFRWDDETLYCSEFVWKVYAAAGIKLCPKRAFETYHLADPAVKMIIDRRYGGIANLPLKELAVAPGDLADSPLLVEAPERVGKRKR